ncbi:MAG: hypothetical protein L3K13_02380, partial [Thermoplasmata archaeon]|nr:hypothetical protein [Thermoplasmata archaeon]
MAPGGAPSGTQRLPSLGQRLSIGLLCAGILLLLIVPSEVYLTFQRHGEPSLEDEFASHINHI